MCLGVLILGSPDEVCHSTPPPSQWKQFKAASEMVLPIPRCAESNFFVNMSPISAMSAVKQKNVSASACSGEMRSTCHGCDHSGTSDKGHL